MSPRDGSARSLPSGVVAFLFSDIEGSTRLLATLGETYRSLLAEHRRLLRAVWDRYGGAEIGTEGDSFFVAFARPSDAIRAARDTQVSLAEHDWGSSPVRVRIGLHAGEAVVEEGDYSGMAVHLAARVSAAAHGGQVLLTEACRTLGAEALEATLGTKDLGRHRLKDIPDEVELHQLVGLGLADGFPPPRTLAPERTNLPAQLTSFVGRQNEVKELAEALTDARLLSIVGVGGVGKTRLALEIASRALPRFGDGVWLADLAPVQETDGLMVEVAAAIGAREEHGTPLADTVRRYLAPRELLLVLDNCEHLVDEAAAAAESILHAAPNVRILATTREALGVPGEIAHRIGSLTSPGENVSDPDEIAACDCPALFVARAAAVVPGFVLGPDNAVAVAEICRRLDGIPLAVELAAARVAMMSPAQIAERLHDRFRLLAGGRRTAVGRQQTLRAAVDWSYQLLTPDERELLDRLSVFVDGWSLDAAEAVCGDGLDVFELMANLVSKSLVIATPSRDGARYSLLETIKQYARERLLERDPAPWHDRHAAYFADLAERAEPELFLPDTLSWLAILDAELGNMRAAFTWALEGSDGATALRISSSLWSFWWLRGLYREGTERMGAAMDALGRPEDLAGASARWRRGFLLAFSGDLTALASITEDAERVCHALGDDAGLAYVYWIQGWTDPDRFHAALEQSRVAGDPLIETWSLLLLGSQVDYDPAAGHVHQARAIAESRGDIWNIAMASNNLGAEDWLEGRLRDALERLERAAAIFIEMGSAFGQTLTLGNLAMAARTFGDFDRFEQIYDQLTGLLLGTESERMLGPVTATFGAIAMDAGNLDEADRHYECAVAFGAGTAQAGPGLLGRADVAIARGDQAAASRFLAIVEDMPEPAHGGRGLTRLAWKAGRAKLALAEDDLVEARRWISDGVGGIPRKWGQAVLYAFLELLAQVVASERPRDAAVLLGAADQIRDTYLERRDPWDAAAYESLCERLRAALGEEFDQALEAGAAMDTAAVLDLAMTVAGA
jgi:predicted ATPase/class 3 adenylate cyclase